MPKQTFCSNPAVLYLFQNCLDMASMPYIGKVGDTAWKQTDLLLGFPRVWNFQEKLYWWSFQSDESAAFLNGQSAPAFNLLRKYSAVIVIWWDSSGLRVPPSLRDMSEQFCCPLEHEWSSLTNSLWMLVSQILMPIILEHLRENAFRSFTIFSLSKLRYSILPDFCPGICLNDHMGFPLLIFCCIANFQVSHPPKEFIPC